MTCALVLMALCAAEMTEDGSAVVQRVAALGTEAVGQEGVATRGIDQVARLPAFAAAVLVLRLDAYAEVVAIAQLRELHLAHATVLDHLCAGALGVTKQDLIEL